MLSLMPYKNIYNMCSSSSLFTIHSSYGFINENVICSCYSGDKEGEKSKLVSKWKPTTKGTLKRMYRVPSNEEGRRLLKEIALVLSEDDHFVDASSHKVISFSNIDKYTSLAALYALI
jgi:hypothetical protein